jgi:hypothetical protein
MPGRNIINSVMGLLGKRHQASTQLSTELIPVRNESYEIEAATQLPIFRAEVLRVTITVGPDRNALNRPANTQRGGATPKCGRYRT